MTTGPTTVRFPVEMPQFPLTPGIGLMLAALDLDTALRHCAHLDRQWTA